ncbi:MAG: transglutaminase-like cysteine peptidase [Porticoccaceae bacterium]
MTMPSPLIGIAFAGTYCKRIFVINTYIAQQISASAKKIALVGFIVSLHSHVAAFEVSEKLLEKVREQHGAVAETRLRNWKKMVKHSDARMDIEKLTLVNEFINRAHLVGDTDSWYKTDARADPLEFLVNHSGDGQDFTVAKLFTLQQMGVDLAKLRISYVKSTGLNRPHTVLAYFPSPTSEPLILDNIERRIKPSSARVDLEPVYLFDPRDVLIVDRDSEQLPEERSNHIIKWQNLLPNLETVQY